MRSDRKPIKTPQVFLDETLEPWDRQPQEGDKAWECFVLYRDAMQEGGVGKRTQRAVSTRVYPHDKHVGNRARREIGTWSVKFRWAERCDAYDRWLDKERTLAFKREARRDAEQALALLRAMRGMAGRALLGLNPSTLSASELTKMADTAIIGIRREAGLATEITSNERDNAFAEWLTRGGDPDDGL